MSPIDAPFWMAFRMVMVGFLTATVWYFVAKGAFWWTRWMDEVG